VQLAHPGVLLVSRVVVYHSYYGCDTGCCGHVVELGDRQVFDFDHPFGRDPIEFAKDMVQATFGEEHVADLDWDACEIVDD
jgi:hypothetical protein